MGLSPRRKPVNLLKIGAVSLSVITAGLFYYGYHRFKPVARQAGQIPHEAYVWQRHWDQAVAGAIKGASSDISGFTALGAEVSFKKGTLDQVVRVELDYEALKATGRPVGLALRIGPYSGAYDGQGEVTKLLAGIAGSLVADACGAGLEPAELQIDFDCAESKLSGYRTWVQVLRREIQPVPVVITALPSWLKCRAFKDLTQVSDGFVLQVHSLERPKGPDAPITLCDSTSALRWVERAARFGVPFRVALPTYGYIVAFDNEGSFIGLAAEGPSQAWGKDATLRAVRSDPIAMAGLVRKWQDSRPANMKGIIWYRLPVETDQLNWKWVTLAAVMAGRAVAGTPKVMLEYPEAELAEIVLLNNGEADLSPRIRIDVECDRGKLLAADSLRGFTLQDSAADKLFLEYNQGQQLAVIAPGERWKVGWLRFKQETEVRANAAELQ
jgi:hypothetical protein